MTSIVFGQFQEVKPPKNIKTLQIFNPQTNDNTPIIRIGGNEYLIFLFDDTNAGYKRYQYSIEHRNADWSESNIFQSEFLSGVNSDYARTNKNSFNTYQKYTNYQIQFPNNQMNVKLAGNYVLKVYLENDSKVIFTQRFSVYQPVTDIGVMVSRYNNPTVKELNQRLQIQVTSGTQNLTESPDGAKLFLMKNNNWNEGYFIDRPTFSRNNQLSYNDTIAFIILFYVQIFRNIICPTMIIQILMVIFSFEIIVMETNMQQILKQITLGFILL